jgi:transcriptional regulator with PAS, ATPase and Fis domain
VLREGALKEVLTEVERKMIAAALERHNGNRTHACEELQVSRWGLVAGGWWLVAGAEDQDLRTR